MRLTLRTLLAHRDGVLDAKDASLLEAKLRDSTFARQISQRIDESMGNPRLAPIPLDAREPGFDPNHVSEYLDDSINVDQVPDLERRFLENNALLSEVGSCHTILTRALSQPAEVSEELRRRIHVLPTTPEAQPGRLRIHRLGNVERRIRVDKPIVAPVSPSAPLSSPTKPISETISQTSLRVPSSEPRGAGIELNEGLGHQVPEYLIGNDRGWWRPVLATVGLLVTLVIVGILAIGPFDQIRQMLSAKDPVASGDNSVVGNGTDVENSSPDIDKPNIETLERSDSTVESSSAKKDDRNAAIVSPTKSNGATLTTENRNATTGESINPNTDVPIEPKEGIVPPVEVPQREPGKANLGVSEPNTSNGLAPANIPSKDWTPSIQWLPESKDSSDTTLFIANSAANTSSEWKKAKPGESCDSSQLILIPPTQRTEFAIAPGLRCIASGDSVLRVMPSDRSPRLAVPFGRLLLFATPDCQSVTLDLADYLIELRFKDVESGCGVDIGWSWNEIESTSIADGGMTSTQRIELIGTQGTTNITWIPKGNPTAKSEWSLEIGEYSQPTKTGMNPPKALESTPSWFRSSAERPIDQHAASDIARALTKEVDRSPKDVLIELAQGRKPETAALATRYLFHFQEFTSFWGKEGPLARKGGFAHAATVVQRLPAIVSNESMKKQWLESARATLETRTDSVLRLLIPMSAKQLEDGGDKLLVEALSSGQQDERTLAILQLSAITGRTLGYHPEKNNSESIVQWRRALGKGEIRLPSAP